MHSCGEKKKRGDVEYLAWLDLSVSFLASLGTWTSYKRNGLLCVNEWADSRPHFYERRDVWCSGEADKEISSERKVAENLSLC